MVDLLVAMVWFQLGGIGGDGRLEGMSSHGCVNAKLGTACYLRRSISGDIDMSMRPVPVVPGR